MRLFCLVLFMSFPCAFGEALYFGMAEKAITPVQMDTYIDSNGNLKRDASEPWNDNNHNGIFDPFYMAGFGQNREASSVHDDILAIAASIQSGNKRVVIVALDTIGWFQNDKDDLLKLVNKTYKIDQLLVHATHNHEAPDTIGLWGKDYIHSGVNADWLDFVKRQAALAIDEAVAREQLAVLSYAQLDEVPKDLGQIDSRPFPDLLDTRLVAAQFSSLNQKQVLGTIVNFGNHVETLWGNNLEITADFPGYLRKTLRFGLDIDGQNRVKATDAPTMFIAGNIGGLATTSDDIPVRNIVTGNFEVQPSFAKAEAQGRYLAALVDRMLKGGQVYQEEEPKLSIASRYYQLPLENLEFFLAGSVAHLFKKSFYFSNWGWKINTESHFLQIGGLSLLTVPGELYPEIAIGGLDAPIGADRSMAPVEWPALYDVMPGQVKMFANTTNDFIGYIIPKSEWDTKKPYITATDSAPYGEGNSLGPQTAPLIHAQSFDLIKKAWEISDLDFHSPWEGSYKIGADVGQFTEFKIDNWGRISGSFKLFGARLNLNVTGYIKLDGRLDFWIDQKVKATGYMRSGNIAGSYEARGHKAFKFPKGSFGTEGIE